jgi:hypothetical protein
MTANINTNGFRVFVNGMLTMNSGGTFTNSGHAGASSTPGAATNAGTLGVGTIGGTPASGLAGGPGGPSIGTLSATAGKGGNFCNSFL